MMINPKITTAMMTMAHSSLLRLRSNLTKDLQHSTISLKTQKMKSSSALSPVYQIIQKLVSYICTQIREIVKKA